MFDRLSTWPLAATVAFWVFATPAAADDISIDPVPFRSIATRQDVRAELPAFKKAGPAPWSISYNPLLKFRSTLTREQVMRKMADCRGAPDLTGEDSGSMYLSRKSARR